MSKIGSKRREWHRSLRWLAIVLLLVSPASSRSAEAAAAAGRFATLIELNGPIGPAMSRYVEQALLDARVEHSPVVILQMDTPGGLDTSMRDIIKAILASPVPVVAYVAAQARAQRVRGRTFSLCQPYRGDTLPRPIWGVGNADFNRRRAERLAGGADAAGGKSRWR